MKSPPPPPPPIRLRGGQGIRLLLQWAVVKSHFGHAVPGLGWAPAEMATGLFFILSGFGTGLSYIGRCGDLSGVSREKDATQNKGGVWLLFVSIFWRFVTIVGRNIEWLIGRCAPTVLVVAAFMPVFSAIPQRSESDKATFYKTPFFLGWFETMSTMGTYYAPNMPLWFIGCILFHWLLSPIWHLCFSAVAGVFAFVMKTLLPWRSDGYTYTARLFIMLGVIVWDVIIWYYLAFVVQPRGPVYEAALYRAPQYGLGFALAYLLSYHKNTDDARPISSNSDNNNGELAETNDGERRGILSCRLKRCILSNIGLERIFTASNFADIGFCLFLADYFDFILRRHSTPYNDVYCMDIPFVAVCYLLTFEGTEKSWGVSFLSCRLVKSACPSSSAVFMIYILHQPCCLWVSFHSSVAMYIPLWLVGHFGSFSIHDVVTTYVKRYARVSMLMKAAVAIVRCSRPLLRREVQEIEFNKSQLVSFDTVSLLR